MRAHRTFKQFNIFKNESTLTKKFLPQKIPQREDCLRKLFSLFKIIYEYPGARTPNVMITGNAGFGKTLLAQLFGREMEWRAAIKNVNLKYIHINCHLDITLSDILKEIHSAVNPLQSYTGGDIREAKHRLLMDLMRNDIYVLLCLDDAEFVFRKDNILLYELMKVKEGALNEERRFAILLISRSSEGKGNLAPWVRNCCLISTFYLRPYTPDQVLDILQERVRLAFHKGVVSKDVIKLIGDKIIHSRDIGQAIEILNFAGKRARDFQSLRIKPDHVEWAYDEINSELDFLETIDLDPLKNNLLIIITKLFEKSAVSSVKKLEIFEEYKKILKLRNIKNGQFIENIDKPLIYSEIAQLERETGYIKSQKEAIFEGKTRGEDDTQITLDIPLSKLESVVKTHLKFEFESEVEKNILTSKIR